MIEVNKEMKKAIEETIWLHEEALASHSMDYTDMKWAHNDGACPLCEYSKNLNTPDEREAGVFFCHHCPWLLIEGCTCESNTIDDFFDDLDYKYNDEASIERLQCWLVGKPYMLGVQDE